MVRIRLRRVGLKKQPSYRIVVADKRQARNGKYLENIGQYNPRTRPTTEVVDEARALHWLSVGAQPSDAVRRIFDHTGTWERFERLRKGEDIEVLVAEAIENAPELPSQRTRFPAPGDGESKIKAKEAAKVTAQAEAEASEAVEEDVAEANDDVVEEEVVEEEAPAEEPADDSDTEE